MCGKTNIANGPISLNTWEVHLGGKSVITSNNTIVYVPNPLTVSQIKVRRTKIPKVPISLNICEVIHIL